MVYTGPYIMPEKVLKTPAQAAFYGYEDRLFIKRAG